ncbi:hypothetical protein V3C99_019074 [Haemonchus contortus]|uniref:UDP-glucuronosyltransferase n=1 Tax=Haemonchus contortus TaxID=6289 RepID=A0A7I4Z0J4_HAECO|nr:UDP-glucuronosyl UDP-glucosyltransferase domain containing protein [Haemonchus contortus]
MNWYILVNLLLVIESVVSYKILILAPKYGISHMNFMSKVADTLVDAGHNVTVYSPNILPHNGPMPTKARTVEADFDGLFLDVESAQRHVWNSDIASYVQLSKVVFKPLRVLVKALYSSDEFHAWIREQNFDIAVSEGFFALDCLLYMMGIRKFVVTVSTNPVEQVVNALGIPVTPSFVPVNNKGFSVPMTYMERALNLLEYVFVKAVIEYSLQPEFDTYFDEKFGKDVWSMQKQAEQTSYIFVNNDEAIDFPRVISHKWHYIGGLRRRMPKPLSPEWEKVYARAKRGVILMSFGTMARSTEMGEARRTAFVKAFQAFPDITFIWRYENLTDNFCNASNIILYDWLPQVDMLNDKRTLAFITHGGMGGVFESAYAGVPVITIPLFADQLRNARMMQYRGMGVVINKDDVTTDRLIAAIQEILQPRYSEAVRRLSEQLQNKPFTPEDILVRHIEHAIRFNVTASLNNASTHQSVIQYYMLDVIVPFLILVTIIILVICRIIFAAISLGLRLLQVKAGAMKIKQN